MPQVIPFTSDPWQTFSCTLNGTEYGFAANYNDRNGVWSFDLSLKAPEEVLVAGVPILLGCDMLAPFGLNIGSLFAVDLAASPAWVLGPVSNDPSTPLSWIGPAISTSQLTIPAYQMLDADPVGAFNDDLGTRVVVVYLAPGESVPSP
jgi:hypothetical protein